MKNMKLYAMSVRVRTALFVFFLPKVCGRMEKGHMKNGLRRVYWYCLTDKPN